VSTEAEAAALKALRAATGETDGGMERHTMRQYLIAERIADMRGISYDRELLLCASFLHDSGLYGPASTGDVYIKDSARYARRTLESSPGTWCRSSPLSSSVRPSAAQAAMISTSLS
jgi:HD superfamily phosphodiesterase